MTLRPDVLVVGAGPTGLALAPQVHHHGGRVRVVLARPGVHILPHRDAPELRASAHGQYVSVHRLMNRGGGLLAIRPDGYAGFRGGTVDDAQLNNWLALVGAAGRDGEAKVGERWIPAKRP